MFSKIVNILILLPVAIVLIVLSIANRGPVTMALNPFRPDDTVLSVTGPFFVFLFVALMIGIVLGGIGTWFTQGRYRKRARKERYDAAKWHIEADRQRERANDLVRQMPSSTAASAAPAPGHPVRPGLPQAARS
jgi:Na+-transporting methylmalonyl-CoA/oxaloacetate decarboxylase gamma subunit